MKLTTGWNLVKCRFEPFVTADFIGYTHTYVCVYVCIYVSVCEIRGVSMIVVSLFFICRNLETNILLQSYSEIFGAEPSEIKAHRISLMIFL